jgi:hypothetical protein
MLGLRPATSALRFFASASSSSSTVLSGTAYIAASRAFSSSSPAGLAQPVEGQGSTPATGKKPVIKEFKIYRWVRVVADVWRRRVVRALRLRSRKLNLNEIVPVEPRQASGEANPPILQG